MSETKARKARLLARIAEVSVRVDRFRWGLSGGNPDSAGHAPGLRMIELALDLIEGGICRICGSEIDTLWPEDLPLVAICKNCAA